MTVATTLATDPRRVWRAARAPVLIAALVLLTGIGVALARGSPRQGYLDPDVYRPEGGRALRQLLVDRDVSVTRTPALSGSGVRTVFVPEPHLLPGGVRGLTDLPAASHLVLGPLDDALLAQLDLPGLEPEVRGAAEIRLRQPGCALTEAVDAGPVRIGGLVYAGGGASQRCYDAGPGSTLLDFAGAVRVTVLGSVDAFTNDRLDQDGDAALALGLLSGHDQVEWLRPRFGELVAGAAGEDRPALLSLLPDALVLALFQLVVAGLVAALWRGRRLGPLVVEPLPAVVHASETTEGRGRLYLAGRARDSAGAGLRAALVTRVRNALGLSLGAERAAVVATVAARTQRPAGGIDALLYGPAPADDRALVRLADDLDTLDREVRR